MVIICMLQMSQKISQNCVDMFISGEEALNEYLKTKVTTVEY